MFYINHCIVISVTIQISLSNSDIIVNTMLGSIQGFGDLSSSGRPFYSFRNIPFAKPPIGNLRFMNPEKTDAWQGIISGNKESPSCPQPNLQLYIHNYTNEFIGQEDCLYLSVYTPKINMKINLPVLFYIHGGGFLVGGSNLHEGFDFMNEDVVLVTVNYRLGVLGFMSTEDDIIPGNLGLKDQTMALEWVQQNIKYFGGDPKKVTIFGESAGATSVHFHVLYPFSKGLFKRAILQSATALSPWSHSSGQRGIAHQVGASVGCFTPGHIGKEQSKQLLDCLQNVDANTLTMSFKNFMNFTMFPTNFHPFVDGKYITDDPEIILRDSKQNIIDIIMGINRDEGAGLVKNILYNSDFLEKLQKNFAYYGPVSLVLTQERYSEKITKHVYEYFLGEITVDRSHKEEMIKMIGQRTNIHSVDAAAHAHAKSAERTRSKVFFYELNYRGQFSVVEKDDTNFGTNWISHADDLFHMFLSEKLGVIVKRNDEDNKMRDIFTRMWVNFAETGDPTFNNSLGFSWDAFSLKSPKHLSITLNPEMKDYTRKEVYEFWSSLPTRQNELLHGACGNCFNYDKIDL